MKNKKQDNSPSAFGRLMEYAGRFRVLTFLSMILSALSSVLALIPFVCIWRIIREVLEVQPDFSRATGIVLSGVGQVTDSSAVKRLLKTLSSKSTYLSDNCSSTSQGLYITLENGITLQFYISGNTLMSCGAWSCAEFLDEFRQIAR